jgi:hypothetical protein
MNPAILPALGSNLGVTVTGFAMGKMYWLWFWPGYICPQLSCCTADVDSVFQVGIGPACLSCYLLDSKTALLQTFMHTEITHLQWPDAHQMMEYAQRIMGRQPQLHQGFGLSMD